MTLPFSTVWKTPARLQGSRLGVSTLPYCHGQTGLQLEHLPREEVAADGGKERKGRECFEPGRFFSNWAQALFEELNKLLVSIFSGVLAAFVPGAPRWEDCPGLCCNPTGVAKLGSSTAACEMGRGAEGDGDKPRAWSAAPWG